VPAGGVREGAVTHPGNSVAGGHLNNHGGGVINTVSLKGGYMSVYKSCNLALKKRINGGTPAGTGFLKPYTVSEVRCQ
jgi:hypothetical protein